MVVVDFFPSYELSSFAVLCLSLVVHVHACMCNFFCLHVCGGAGVLVFAHDRLDFFRLSLIWM